MKIKLRVIKADNGDCVLISYLGKGSTFNILIDGGTVNTFRRPNGAPGPLKILLNELKDNCEHVDLGILTHIDSDHIGGMKRAFETEGYLSLLTKKLWYNSSQLITQAAKIPDIIENHVELEKDVNPETSFKQAFTLEKKLNSGSHWYRELILAGQTFREGPFTLKVLSPDKSDVLKLAKKWPKEYVSAFTAGSRKALYPSLSDLLLHDVFQSDPAPANRSSIAFLLEHGNFKALLLGDAPDETIQKSLKTLGFSSSNKLKLDFVKVSHHGSQYNTSQDFLSMLECSHFIISTNGTGHAHPDRLTIARILQAHPNAKLHFNYEENIRLTFSDSEISRYSENISTICELDFSREFHT